MIAFPSAREMLGSLAAMGSLVLLSACGQTEVKRETVATLDQYEDILRTVHKAKPAESSPAVAMLKLGSGVESWLLTVHGYANNQQVCELLIEEYNRDEELSVIPGVYRCEEIARTQQ